MPIDVPYRLPLDGPAPSNYVQANFESLVFSLRNTIAGGTFSNDITITTAGNGLVLTTPNGLHTYRIAITNDGQLTTEQLT